MHDTQIESKTSDDPFSVADSALSDLGAVHSQQQATTAFHDISQAAVNASQSIAADAALLFAQLVEILSVSDDAQNGDGSRQADIAEFLRGGVVVLRSSLEAGDDSELYPLIEQARGRWGEWLELVDGELPAPTERDWDTVDDGSDEFEEPSKEQLELILSSLASANEVEAGPSTPPSSTEAPASYIDDAEITLSGEPFTAGAVEDLPTMAPRLERPPSLDGELLEAYLDDANRCLSAIESTVIAYEERPHDQQPLQQMCRELHTLKGASASVGLTDLAGYLHQVEEFVQAQCDAGSSADAVKLLASVDIVRSQIATLQKPVEGEPTPLAATNKVAASSAPEISHDSDETVRVKASQLDRLMDMLAELVMLRNGRESRTADLQRLNDELIRCATRLRTEDDAVASKGLASRASNPLREVATDVLEIARSQREVSELIAGENLAVSRFIRSFRQELTEVRRLPVSGLFHRLQRAVHDAARTENKKVRLEMIGEHAGLERSLQEKLYEPLLHIVRNSVSHGIESEEARIAAGKPSGGTVTLEARGASNLLILEIRDDGGGLDYDAIRRRGIERGILAADQAASRAELAQLIFHPGFSTRDGANAVAGRGVGMDVVAEAVERMRSWIEVESSPGEGTKIRLSIPLQSVIEHTMVFRCGGQLFAVPMQYVRAAGEGVDDDSAEAGILTTVACNDLIRPAQAALEGPQQRLVIGFGKKVSADSASSKYAQSGQQLSVLVDDILGPEEVVVRPLPPLLRHQSLVSGVTLSGTGELLLLLDSQQLIERGINLAGDSPATVKSSKPLARAHVSRVLVVDDSISARRALTRPLKHFGLETIEASDGIEALELLRDGGFAAVFSDLEMPRAGGLDLLREVSSFNHSSRVPVIIVSSRDEEDYKQQAKDLGAVAYLTKPAPESRVADELRRLGLLPTTRGEGEVH